MLFGAPSIFSPVHDLVGAGHRGGRVQGGLAIRCAEVCLAWLPRLVVVGPCCGAAGVGHLLVDLAEATGERRYRDAAYDVLVQLLLPE
ncbi:hypothetical protein [Nonomuraea sp. NPDC003201]